MDLLPLLIHGQPNKRGQKKEQFFLEYHPQRIGADIIIPGIAGL
jgi:hypothetical protein